MRPVRSAPLVRRRLILVIAPVVSCLGTCLCGIANASVTLGSKLSALFDSATGSQNVYYATPSGALQEIYWTPSGGFQGPVTVSGPGTLAASAISPPHPGSGTTTLLPPRPRAHPRRRTLRVKIILRWRWRGRVTRLVGITFGRLPRGARLTISCRGHGCPRRVMTARAHRFAHQLVGRGRTVYQADDRLLVALNAPNYAAERAEVRIRLGRTPVGRLLS
jgi:hypothetical protein